MSAAIQQSPIPRAKWSGIKIDRGLVPCTHSFLRPLGRWEDLHDKSRETDDLTIGIEAVIVPDSAAPGDAVQTIPKTVGVLVVAGLLEALRRDVHVIVSGAEMPGQSDVFVAFPEVGKHFLRLLIVRVWSGRNGLQPGRGVACYIERGGAHRNRFAVDRAPVAQLPRLLDDCACRELGLRRYVESVRPRLEQLCQLRPVVSDVGRISLFGYNPAAVFLELRHGGASDTLGVIGLLR